MLTKAIADKAQTMAYQAAQPVQPGETVKAQLRRAWQELGCPPFWRVRAAFYGEAGGWSAAAFHDLQDRYVAMMARRASRAAAADLTRAARLEAAATALEAIDAKLLGPDIDRYRALADELRSVASERPAPGR